MDEHIEAALMAAGAQMQAKDAEIERLRDIVRKGRAAYSGYGLLATPPGRDMHTKDGQVLCAAWLRATDEYLHGIGA